MAASRCRWCNRLCTPEKGGYCSDECRKLRNRLARKYPEAREHTPEFGVDWEGFIYFVAAFFDDLRGRMGQSKPEALAFVMGRAGQYDDWCLLLEVPDRQALASHLMAQWGVPYLQYTATPKPPSPPAPISGKSDPKCATCGEEDPQRFNRRGEGYRSYCKDCEAGSIREYRARRKAKLQEKVPA